MARKKKEKIVLEDIELQPQVIGYTYKKKSNIGRAIIIFIFFLLAIIYINDISLIINNLLGKSSAPTINENSSNNKKPNKNNNDIQNEVKYNAFSNTLTIKEEKFTLNNFNYLNNKLSFDIVNNQNNSINLKNNKYFIETYSQEKTLLERHKVDINNINTTKISKSINLKNDFYYIVFIEKNIEDYPTVNLESDQYGNGTITCNKDNETLVYKFNNNELFELRHTIVENDPNADSYYIRYNNYRNKSMSYNNLDGITSSFNSSLNGYTVIFVLDLQKVNLENIDDLYYYSYKTIPKVVKFEMQTYGFICN